MPKETKAEKTQRAIEVCKRMDKLYPQAECALNFNNAFQCVIAVSLSAQTTDANVNKVTPQLFEHWGTPQRMAQASLEEIERTIRSIGLYKNKARNAIGCARMIMSDFNGEVPNTMKELQRLPGVGRKTANIVLNNVFGIVEGIAVDTHVNRIAHRLGFATKKETDPLKVEAQLLDIIPENLWERINHQWVLFGREFCSARNPLCDSCPLLDICTEKNKK